MRNNGPAVCVPRFQARLCATWPTEHWSSITSTGFDSAQWLEPIIPNGNIDLGQHCLMLQLCAVLVKYGFPESMAISQAHSPVKCTQPSWKHIARWTAHSPAMLFWTGKLTSCSKLHSSWNAWTMYPNKMCSGKYGLSVLVVNCICENPSQAKPSQAAIFRTQPGKCAARTTVCIYIAGLCVKLPGCVEGHQWVMSRDIAKPGSGSGFCSFRTTQLVEPMLTSYLACVNQQYHQVSNIRRTKSQNLKDSHTDLRLSLPNPLKPDVKSRMKM